MGRCPFPDHQEKTASFSVSDTKQVYHCFGCKKSGNVFTFLRDYNGMNFPDAVEYLAERARIPIPEIQNSKTDSAQFQQQYDHKKTLLKINKMAAEFYKNQFAKSLVDSPVKNYVKKRKMNDEILEVFQIGYASPEWEGLTHYLQKNRIKLVDAEEVKLIKLDQNKMDFMIYFVIV